MEDEMGDGAWFIPDEVAAEEQKDLKFEKIVQVTTTEESKVVIVKETT